MTKTMLEERYDALRRHGHNEKQAATLAVRALKAESDPVFWKILTQRVAETTYSRRSYGRGVNYCYAYHAALGLIDPWPAVFFPVSVLTYEHAKILLQEESHAEMPKV